MLVDPEVSPPSRTHRMRKSGSATAGPIPTDGCPPGHTVRMWTGFLPALILLASSCSRMPTESASGRPVARDTAIQTKAALSGTVESAIIMPARTTDVDSLARSFGSQVLDVVPELSLALLRTPPNTTTDAFVSRLRGDPRVVFSESNAMVETAEAGQSTVAFCEAARSWSDVQDQTALARVGAAQAQAFATGEGALVAILDTGIDLDHPALTAMLALPGYEAGVTTDAGDDRPESVDSNGDGIVDGSLGHGTHVAGIVHAMAPAARLLPVRVLDSDGVGESFRIAQGIVAAVERGADVINLSLGLPSDSRSIEAAVNFARSAGVVIVAAAGNRDASALDFPASYAPVLAVAGTDPDDRKASFSDYGDAVDLAAPAVGILSTYWDGTFARWSGTSMASPFVAGTAALLYGRLGPPSASSADLVERLILAGAHPLAAIDPVYGALLGAGRLSAAASLYHVQHAGDPGGPPRTRELAH